MFTAGFRKKVLSSSSFALMRKGAWQQVLEVYWKASLYLLVHLPKNFQTICMGFQCFVPNLYSSENVATIYDQ